MSQLPPGDATSNNVEHYFKQAAVAADSRECSEIGTSIMRDHGGSAMDAAIAAALCSSVVNAHSCSIGGGAIITLYKRSEEKMYSIIGREQAPSKLTTETLISDPLSKRIGGLSICIPGEICSLYEGWKLAGRLPWKQLFQPAIKMCKNGVKVRAALAKAIDEDVKNKNLQLKERVPGFLEFLTNPETGEIYKEGDIMYRPVLAKTLEKIADEGPDCFYRGSLTDDMIADITDANGILTKEDFANYTALIKPPLSLKLTDDFTVYSPPLPTSGILYQYILDLLKDFKFDQSSVSTVEKSIETWHRITEAFKHTGAVKQYLGDNDICTDEVKDSIDEMVRKARNTDYIKSKRAKILDTKTFNSTYYDNLNLGNQHKDHGTSHLSVIGPNGDAVSISCSNSLHFGSKIVGTRTGIVFNDTIRNFSLPNVNSRYNSPPLKSNLAEPLRRPLTAMCPSIVVDRKGDVKLVIGGSGATRIPTSLALITIETLLFKWGIKEAIHYPRLHHQLYPSLLYVQLGFPKEVVNGLQHIGHEVADMNPSIIQGILKTGDKITACGDYRKDGHASGF
ncbi:glutathione hydrolase 1 proenzyme-like [Ruditapes philippinarum]|uniref:glutathione hydrolase 1 proenzyme-like n=1 Tax=Ruditapes philippinarum TaxID=129788 RepID=UPI00295B04C4|nr:glutathione hydrolase 1 proenzyme-like [Ruditapes philippinarum]